MSILFTEERFSPQLLLEAGPLLQAHWGEIALWQEVIKLQIDVGFYERLSARGKLLCVTARRGTQGELVGYAAFFDVESPHYQGTQFLRNDVIYLKPEVRGGATALRFIRECEGLCAARKKDGVPQLITWHAKLSNDFAQLLRHLGYTDMEVLLGKLT